MIIPPALALLALTPPASTPAPNTGSSNPLYPVLCWDPRYATQQPSFEDCISIISRYLLSADMTQMLIFSRHAHGSDQWPLPYRWQTEKRECAVVIDTPQLPTREEMNRAEASMLDIKAAALDILGKCVLEGHHLGGITTTGQEHNLQVRLESFIR